MVVFRESIIIPEWPSVSCFWNEGEFRIFPESVDIEQVGQRVAVPRGTDRLGCHDYFALPLLLRFLFRGGKKL